MRQVIAVAGIFLFIIVFGVKVIKLVASPTAQI